MKYLIFILLGLGNALNCLKPAPPREGLLQQDSVADFEGVVYFNADSLKSLHKVAVSDSNGGVVGRFVLRDELLVWEKGESKIGIHAYYPDYGVYVFKANKRRENEFEVAFNAGKKILRDEGGSMIFQTWSEHLLTHLVATDMANPLLPDTSEHAGGLDWEYTEASFVVLEVEGDWLRVECEIECEGCPDNIQRGGWLRWRKEGVLLVEFVYVC